MRKQPKIKLNLQETVMIDLETDNANENYFSTEIVFPIRVEI